MTREEAVEILQTIHEIYPKFDLMKRKATLLIPNLLKMDYQGVLGNLSVHVMNYPYPPTLQEIASYPKERNELQDMITEWETEAKKVTPELRQQFIQAFDNLLSQIGSEDR